MPSIIKKKYILIIWLIIIPGLCQSQNVPGDNKSSQLNIKTDRLPQVLPDSHNDLIAGKLKLDAMLKFAEQRLPENLRDWETYRIQLKEEIIKKAGVIVDHKLPLNIKETGRIKMPGYSVKNIAFQTRPGIYATANLYIPEGNGPFPAVIYMLGHWEKGKIDSTGPQAVGHCLAVNGYVCLTVDPWGSGERTTVHGIFEDHGDENNLGSALMNIGEPLIGIEISDNIRGVDLLCSLPFVDPGKIGATGASGGGNQTMWLASVDERIKAAMLVVSAGTFESHIMGSPCICEVMPDALNFTEEAGVLALVAPRALKMCNHKKDGIPAFLPSEMIRSYNNAKPVFKMYGDEENISYQVFDLPHGYMAEDRKALIEWFDLHLKGTGTAKQETIYKQLPEEKLMVFPKGQRDTDIKGTVEYCIEKGNILKTAFLNSRSFDTESKKKELRDILGVGEKSSLNIVHKYPEVDGWRRFALETSDNKLIPVLLHASTDKSNEFVIVANPEGKDKIQAGLINEIINSGKGIAIVDLSGTGEASSTLPGSNYSWGRLRTISRSELWFGRTLLGEWVKELNIVVNFLNSDYKANKISMDGSKEAGIAGLFLSALEGNLDNIILRTAPVSYLFDTRKGVDFFSSAINLPGFLSWGDVSLAAALSGKSVLFINPVSISGNVIDGEKLSAVEAEFEKVRRLCNQKGNTVFKTF
jgi:hypothetical protein